PRSGAPAPSAPRAPEPLPPQHAEPPVQLPPIQYPATSPDAPDAAGQGGTRRRPLLDLFPPAPDEIAPGAPRPAAPEPPAPRPQPTRRPSLADMIAPTEEITYETFYGLNE